MLSDTISWLQLDSLQVLKLERISRTPSSIQSYAMAARALRGDTVYHRFPFINANSGSRIGQFPTEEVAKQESKNRITLFPNPNRGEFTLAIESIQSGVYTIEIADIAGRVLLNRKISVADKSLREQISLSTISGGIYFLRVYSSENSVIGSHKLIISK
jgi:hypothetical protein